MEKFSEKVASVIVGLVVLGLIALAGYPLLKCISADGKVDYCYVVTERHMVPNQADVVVYQLMGFRPWRQDRCLSPALRTLEDVKNAAEQYSCTLR